MKNIWQSILHAMKFPVNHNLESRKRPFNNRKLTKGRKRQLIMTEWVKTTKSKGWIKLVNYNRNKHGDIVESKTLSKTIIHKN